MFGKRERKRAHYVKRWARFRLARLSILQHAIKAHGRTNRCKWPAPAATHRISNAGTERGSFFCLLALDLAQKTLEIFNGDAVARAGRRNPGKISVSQFQLLHARSHSRGQKSGTFCSSRNRQLSGTSYTFAVPLAHGDSSLFFASGNFHG